jgi:DNA repair exonuclease SbcCD nuclease subunit
MPIRVLTIGDPHLRADQMPRSKRLVDSILIKVQELNPDAVIILGDTLHTHDVIKVGALALAYKFVYDLSQLAPVYVLVGNHDIAHNQVYLPEMEHPEHPFVGLNEWKNVTVCDKATKFEIMGMTFCGVPYVPPGRYMEAIKEIDISEIKAFFSHQEFRGVKARLSDTIGSLDSEIWPANFPLNICGHYHEAQIIADNLIYVGTPDQQSSAESENKGVSLFTFSDVDRLDVETSNVNYEYERIPLHGTIKRRQYDLMSTDTEILSSIYAFIESNEDYIIKIIFSGTPQENKTLRKHRIVKKLLANKKVNVVFYTGKMTENDNTFDEIPTRKSFIEFLNERLEEDSEAYKCYKTIFS